MSEDMHPLHAKEYRFTEELGAENLPRERRFFIYGYLNVSRGSVDYASGFFTENYRGQIEAENPALLKAFLDGIREATSDNVAMYGGMSDAYKLVSSENLRGTSTTKVSDIYDKSKERNLSNRELVVQAFFEGIADGFRRIGEKDVLTEVDVGAFILAAGEQSRRVSAIMSPIPTWMKWPVIPVTYYQRVKNAIISPPVFTERHTKLWELIESFPHNGDTAEYEEIFSGDDLRFLIEGADNIGKLDVIQGRLRHKFKPECTDNLSLLRQRTRNVADHMFYSGNNLDYSFYTRGIGFNYIPSGIVGQEFETLERQYNAKAREVERRRTSGRLIVVFNDATGLRVVERAADDLKQGVPYALVSGQDELPDTYLPPRQFTVIPDDATPEQIAKFVQLSDEYHASAVASRRAMFQKMRESLPEIRLVIQSMGLNA